FDLYRGYRADLEDGEGLARRYRAMRDDNPVKQWFDDTNLLTMLEHANETHDLGIDVSLLPCVIRRAGAMWEKEMERTCTTDGWQPDTESHATGTGKAQIHVSGDVAIARYVVLDETCLDDDYN